MGYVVEFVIVFVAALLGSTIGELYIIRRVKNYMKEVETIVPVGTKIPFSGTSTRTGVWRSKEEVQNGET
jgi:hypothetical protein